jgi:hypothetical protein
MVIPLQLIVTCARIAYVDVPSRAHGSTVLSELVVGSYLGAPVLLVKDSDNRFWLRAFRDGEMVEFVLVADDLMEFTGAVAQAAKDLEN